MTDLRPNLDRKLRALVGAFLDETGTSARRFGVEALGDPGFMASLDRGRALGLKTVDRLLAFMGLAPWRPRSGARSRRSSAPPAPRATCFGELALNDPSFVDRLRRGASFRLSTVARARSWMAGQACGPGARGDAPGGGGRAAARRGGRGHTTGRQRHDPR